MPNGFSFKISLSVLDHLGRNLYRSFATVFGEAISNAWDADAKTVSIHIDRDKDSFFIKDDGVGMTANDFQNKFLKIGYAKRSEGNATSPAGRPYIGRKGIGKLALLSCAEKIHVISKPKGGEYIGGVIDNSGLDDAIKGDSTPDEYQLGGIDLALFAAYTSGHEQGTIIYFENIKDGIKNSLEFLKKTVALYFRFALVDPTFRVFIDGHEVTLDDLNDLAKKTEFLWNINELDDPFVKTKLDKTKEPAKPIAMSTTAKGFIASVAKPGDLSILGTGERVRVDLFVNGRLRERDILKHIPTARIAESYFYGQIHFDELNDDTDRFTSSREGIVAEDPKYNAFLAELKRVLGGILEDWDEWRIKHKKVGDHESDKIPPKQRSAIDLYNAVSTEYDPEPKETGNEEDASESRDQQASDQKQKVDGWVNDLRDDASFNLQTYAECFISENLVRRYIVDKGIDSTQMAGAIADIRRREKESKERGNVNIVIRLNDDDLGYLDMSQLAVLADQGGIVNTLRTDARTYKPIRDGMAHTARLTVEAKNQLTSVYENIKGGIKRLLFPPNPPRN